MPAPESSIRTDKRPALGHVNLMVDSFIANASADDLRAIVRSLLASSAPATAAAFTAAARARLRQGAAKPLPSSFALFARRPDGAVVPTQQLHDTLMRARSFYGAGMGFAALAVLVAVVRATIGIRWAPEGDLPDALAVVDADIGQAIQSAKEETDGGRVGDASIARAVVGDLRAAVHDSRADVDAWGGEFPFERAASSVLHWKI